MLNKIWRAVTKADEKEKKQAEIDNRNNIQNRIKNELSPNNCPAEEIVSRFQSVIKDENFKSYTDPSKKVPSAIRDPLGYFSHSDAYNAVTSDLFIKVATANASRVLPKDATDFAEALFVNDSFSKLDPHYYDNDAAKGFLTYGLALLAGRVPPEDKIEFFHACETKLNLAMLLERGTANDAAAFLYNVFGKMNASEVEGVLNQSSILSNIPVFDKTEAFIEAFKAMRANDMDPQLPYIFEKHIGYSPKVYTHNFEDRQP